ncbi:protein-disulfide reductase DsbD domain-containing protein, partial [Marinobacter sp.]
MTGNNTASRSSAPHRVLNRFLLFLALSTVSLFASGAGNSLFGGSNDFLPVDEALPFNYTVDTGAIVLSWDVTPEHYLYKGRIQVSSKTDGVTLGEPVFSYTGTDTEDEFFGKVTVFYDPVQARVPVNLPEGVREAELQVTYQGCAKAGLCYPPQTRDALYYASSGSNDAPVPAGMSGSSGSSGTTQSSSTNAPSDTSTATGLAGFLANQSVLVIAALFLLLGLGLTFTPCVLPMVPIISSLVSSRNTSTTAHALLLSGSYVLGMALTYAAAGVITGLLGASFNLQAHLQSPWVLSVFAALFVVFALSMFNLFEIQLPRFIREPLNDASHRLTGSRVISIFGIGALSALIVSPCV